MRTFSAIACPAIAILRLWRCAAHATCWMREMSEAKVATMIRPVRMRKTRSKASSIDALGGRPAGPVGVGAVARAAPARRAPENSASLAKSGGQLIDRRVVELEIAGVDDQARPAY